MISSSSQSLTSEALFSCCSRPFSASVKARIATLFAEAFALGEDAHNELARLYETGVTQDLQKAEMMLKGLPKEETKAVLDEIEGR